MDIYAYLKRDHEKVKELFERAVAARNLSRRRDLYRQIREELLLHAKTEEATFYAALKGEREIGERMKHAKEEHQEMEDYIKHLDKMNIESGTWFEVFGEFKHSVTHHVEEEEGEIFEKARKILSHEEAKELAIRMDDMKQELSGRMKKSA
jgi:hemerythrin superfamily protein